MEQQITHALHQPDYQKRVDIIKEHQARVSELMDSIKEQLIIKEIERYGIEHVESKLSYGRRWQWADKDSNTPVLIIKRTFFKPKSKNDQLTKDIFYAIPAFHAAGLEETKKSLQPILSKFLSIIIFSKFKSP